MVNKFEFIGIMASVALMALALFLLRVESATLAVMPNGNEAQPALAVVSGDSEGDLRETLADAVDTDGDLQKLVIDDVHVGTGAAVKEGDTVTVHYIGRLPNGQEFDNSYNHGEPFTFTVGQNRVIAGWEEGIKGMQVNGQRILVVPPELGYGSIGVGPIPPNATLLFTVELLEIQ